MKDVTAVVEGCLAGGHLGFSMDDVATAHIPLEVLVMARFLQLGASGVQMGTRFVCMDECDASVQHKEAYVHCRQEDILVIQRPLKLPLRVDEGTPS